MERDPSVSLTTEVPAHLGVARPRVAPHLASNLNAAAVVHAARAASRLTGADGLHVRSDEREIPKALTVQFGASETTTAQSRVASKVTSLRGCVALVLP